MADTLVHDHGDNYDQADVAALTRLVRDSCTWAYIAERLGRTPAAVRGKWYRLRQAGAV